MQPPPSPTGPTGRHPLVRAVALVVALALVPAVVPGLSWVAPASAQIRVCEGSDGSTVFTDRNCDEVDAVPATPGAAVTRHQLRSGCARNVRELVWEVSTAIDLGDVNRLAGVYHWTGMSAGNGRAIMDRLQSLVRHPLLHVTPVVHRPPPRPWSVLDDHEPARVAEPVALQLDQLQPGGGSHRTTFDLREHFGCVWIAG